MPALPQLQGVVFRPFRDESDYPHFARIITAFAKGEGSDRVETADGIAAGYDHLERCDPKHDLLVAEVDDRPLGYGRVWWDQEPDGPRIYRQVCFVDPDGVEIRPVSEDQLRAIWEADVEAFRDHWGYVEPTETSYAQFLAFPHHDPTLWKIAWDDEGVAGQVRSFIDPAQNAEHDLRRGWTEFISTSRRWRRRGLAKALIVDSIRELAARGMTDVALGVHTENPNGAFDLYAGLGYEVVAAWTTFRKPL